MALVRPPMITLKRTVRGDCAVSACNPLPPSIKASLIVREGSQPLDRRPPFLFLVASIQNKANFPFHQPGLLTGNCRNSDWAIRHHFQLHSCFPNAGTKLEFSRVYRGILASLVAQMVKNLQETWVWSLSQEDPLEKGKATLSSILAWRIPWTEEPDRPQSTGSQSQTWPSDWHFLLSFLVSNKSDGPKGKPPDKNMWVFLTKNQVSIHLAYQLISPAHTQGAAIQFLGPHTWMVSVRAKDTR